MTKEQEKFLYGCTIEGFINDFNSAVFGNATDTINSAIAYILKYNMHLDYTDCDLKELIFTARNEVAKAIARKQLEKDPNDLGNMQSGMANEEVKHFLNDPVDYLYTKFIDEKENYVDKEFIEMIHLDHPRINPKERENYYLESCLSARVIGFDCSTTEFRREYKNYEKNIAKNQIFTSLLCAKLAVDDNTVSASFNKQKAGFFEKLFNTTSEEYNNFKAAFANYNNKDHALYGDDKYLKDAAMGYLQHKFPNLEEGKLPTLEQIASLGGAGKERANFCLKIVETYNENHDAQIQADKLLNAIKPKDLEDDFSDISSSKEPLYHSIDSLEKDVEDSYANDNNIIQENDNNIENEIVNSKE